MYGSNVGDADLTSLQMETINVKDEFDDIDLSQESSHSDLSQKLKMTDGMSSRMYVEKQSNPVEEQATPTDTPPCCAMKYIHHAFAFLLKRSVSNVAFFNIWSTT